MVRQARYDPAMAVDLPASADALTADELQAQTRGLARRAPPAGLDGGGRPRRRRRVDARCAWGSTTPNWCIRFGEAGYATPTWPAEYGAGLSLSPGEAKQVNDVLERLQGAAAVQHHRHRHGRPDGDGVGHRGDEAPAAAAARVQPGDLVPAVQRAGRGLRRRRARDACGARRRRVGRQRSEGLDHGRAHLASGGCCSAAPNPDVPEAQRASRTSSSTCTQPGVEVRPLVQITGDAEFNEVFFNDARVRHDWMLGREGDGWKVAITTLMNERVSLSGAGSIGGDAVGGSPVDRLLERHTGIDRPDPAPAARAGLHREPADPAQQPARAADKRKSGGEAGPEGSITKLHAGRVQPAAPEARGRPRGRRAASRGRATALVEDAARSGARAEVDGDALDRASGSCGRRPTRSRAAPPTSCATSSASGCSGSQGARHTRASCRGTTCPLGLTVRAVPSYALQRVPTRGSRPVRR